MSELSPVLKAIQDLVDEGGLCWRPIVGWSGGLDSSVLLAALKNLGLNPLAVHVNHHLQPAAIEFEEHCKRSAHALGIELEVLHLDSAKLEGSVETWARQERYRGIFKAMRDRGGSQLWLAHHQDDQIETVLTQLLRGSGQRGIRGMSRIGEAGVDRHQNADIQIVRPFLGLKKTDLEAFARQHAVAFVEDPSNEDLHHRRNWLRLSLLPEIRTFYPQADGAILDLARFASEHFEAVDALASDLLSGCLEGGRLKLAIWCKFADTSRVEVLRLWLLQHGIRPGKDKLLELERQLLTGQGGEKSVAKAWRVHVRRHMAVAVLNPAPIEGDEPTC